MPTLRQNDAPVRLTLNATDMLSVVPAAGASMSVIEVADPSIASPKATITSQTTLGPFSGPKTVTLTVTAGSAFWEVKSAIRNIILVSPNAPDNNDGRADGTVYIQSAS